MVVLVIGIAVVSMLGVFDSKDPEYFETDSQFSEDMASIIDDLID